MTLPNAQRPILCYVTDRNALSAAGHHDPTELLLTQISVLAAAGIDWIQLREKDLSARALSRLTREALRRVTEQPTALPARQRILLNDRLDVALAENAGGVHLGESSLPVAEAKRLLTSQIAKTPSADFLLGVSCHALESAKAAAASGASYLIFGPVFHTPSKASYGEPQGLQRLAEVCAAVNVPVLAIGGITAENAHECAAAGAAGVAAIRLFQDARDPAGVVIELRRQFA